MAETVTLDESGRIILPSALRKKFGLKPGDRLTLFATDGDIRIRSMRMALEKVRAEIISRRGSLSGILDEFLDEKHEEARREAAGE